MRAFVILIALVFACTATPQNVVQASDGSPSTDDASAEPMIAVKRTVPSQVVYLVHAGHYWTVGPALTRLKEYMLQHNQPGPMYTRYLDDPTIDRAHALQTEIGFYVEGTHEPSPPYEIAKRESALVAHLLVDGPLATAGRHHAAMRRWALAHNYMAAGPMTEIYLLPGNRGEDKQRTELQMPIEVASRKGGRPPEPAGRPQAAQPEPAATFSHAHLNTAEEHANATSDVAAAQDKNTEPADALPSPSRRQSVLVDSVRPVADLVEERQFDRIAAQLIPGDRAFPPNLQVWVGQVAFRIGAIGNGIEKAYPGEAETVSTLAEAITHRYQHVSVYFQLDPLDQAVVRADVKSDPHGAEKLAIMRQLDTILGRLALKSIDADTVLDELTQIAQRVQDVVHVTQP